jgi:LPXTG-site transpeptidase (sortase) family protein
MYHLSSRFNRNQLLVLILAAILIVAGGILVLTSASGSNSPSLNKPASGQTLDTDPQIIGSGGAPVTPTATPTTGSQPRPTATIDPTPAGTRTPRSTPVSPTTPIPNQPRGPLLSIPAIGVAANVETKGTDANNVMQNPDDPSNVAWYSFTATPGVVGNAVFAGHVDYVGLGKTVFGDLAKLRQGDEISYTSPDGQTFRYRVTATATAWSNDAANQYVAPTSTEMITLITCTGSFDRSTLSYNQRLIVQATRIP